MGSTPLLKGCLQKYYAQTYRVHYTHTDATHFGFNSSNNACVSTPVSRIQRTHSLRTHQRLVATIETMSKLRLIHALLPLHLGMAICYQYESAYFPAPYVDNQLLCSFCGPKWVTPLILRASNTTTRFSSRLFNFCNINPTNTPKKDFRKSEIFLGAYPQTPLTGTLHLL